MYAESSQSAFDYFETDELIWFAPSQLSSSLLEIYIDDDTEEETEPTSRQVSQRSDPTRINFDESELYSEDSSWYS